MNMLTMDDEVAHEEGEVESVNMMIVACIRIYYLVLLFLYNTHKV